MGLPVFCDAPFEFAPGQPMWYCNQLFIQYHLAFDRYFEAEDRLAQMKADFRQLCNRIGDGTVVMYTHPVRLFTQKFADNFRHGRNIPKAKWVPAPMRPRAQIEELIRDFEAFVRYVAGEGIEVIDYRRLYEQYRETQRWIDRATLTRLAEKIQAELNYQIVNGVAYSPAEIFGVIVFALDGYQKTGELPWEVPVRRLLGPTRVLKFEEAGEPVGVDALLQQAGEINAALTEERRVPAVVVIEHRPIAPGSFLKAAAQVLQTIATGASLPTHLSLDLKGREPAIVQRSDFSEMGFGWSMFYPGFEGERVVEMAKLQAWTAKPALRR